MVEKVHLIRNFVSCLLVNCLVGGGGVGCWGVGNYNIISINKEFVDRLDGKLPFLITEIWGENIHTNVWYRY